MSGCTSMKYIRKGRYAVCERDEDHEGLHRSCDGLTWKQVPTTKKVSS